MATANTAPVGRPVLHTAARARRASQATGPGGSGGGLGGGATLPRPTSVYEATASSPPTRIARAASVQPRSATELSSPSSSSPPTRDSRAASAARTTPNGSIMPPAAAVSRVQIGGGGGFDRPLDRPTVVRPTRVSLQEENNIEYYDNTPTAYHQRQQQLQQQRLFEEQQLQQQRQALLMQQQQQQSQQPYVPSPDMVPFTNPEPLVKPQSLTPPVMQQKSSLSHQQSPLQLQLQQQMVPSQPLQEQQQQQRVPLRQKTLPSRLSSPGKKLALEDEEKPVIVPMNADKPSGLQMEDFMPRSMVHPASEPDFSRFTTYKGIADTSSAEPTESEAASGIVGGHRSMMSALTSRGRNLEIIHKLWQNKDAKTGWYF